MNVQNRRKQHRLEFTDAVTITPKGVCQVINIGSGGISFKCLHEQFLSKKWEIDIIDSITGSHLQEFPVEKVWDSVEGKKRYASRHTTTVGVKFKNLSPKQRLALYELIYR